MRLLLVCLCLILSACGAVQSVGEAAREDGATAQTSSIGSSDFALLPCGPDAAIRPCALLMAGGKRVLIGAPAGAADRLSDDDLRLLDAVLLFSLRSDDLDGLAAVRNQTWLSGRKDPLNVAGPDGVAEVIAAINTAFEPSDAFAYVERRAPAGFDSALLVDGGSRGAVFDTGDLVISASEDGLGRVRYTAVYGGVTAHLIPCGHEAEGALTLAENDIVLACDSGDLQWPLRDTHMIDLADEP